MFQPSISYKLTLFAFFLSILLPTISARAQSDSVIVLSPRVGRVIDSHERAYFDVFRDCPDSEFVFLAEDTGETGRFIFRSSNPERLPTTIDSALLIKLQAWIDCREAVKEGVPEEERANVRDEEEGAVVTVETKSSWRRSGELLFADLHGIVIRDSMAICLLASDIRSITSPRVFGEGMRTMAQVGVATGVVIFGIGGALGQDAQSGGGVFVTAFFSGLGVAAGLLYDLFASTAGDVKVVSAGQEWHENLIRELQLLSRFPLGTPELKQLLGNAREFSLRQP